MQQIGVYIDLDYKGNFKSGDGKFSIVLEWKEKTKKHFGAYSGTTKNRLGLLACIRALMHVKKPCEILIHIDSPYVSVSVKELDKWVAEGLDKRKNGELWKKYIKLSKDHVVTFKQEKINEYSPAMKIERQMQEFVVIEDYRAENEV